MLDKSNQHKYILAAKANIMDFEKLSTEKKQEIELAIVQEYQTQPEIDMEEIRLNMLEKCVFMNP